MSYKNKYSHGNHPQERKNPLYSNPYLVDFLPIFCAILEEKKIPMEKIHLEIIDEETENYSLFETVDSLDVLWQIAPELNFLSIYTDRPEYFKDLVAQMYDENGLLINIFSKKMWRRYHEKTNKVDNYFLALDFEWIEVQNRLCVAEGQNYIPIHKKPWKMAENLDIAVPFGYNTVIVKSKQMKNKKPVRDRFEEAFYM